MAKRITIGVDVSVLNRNLTGVKTYLEELCREFKLLEDDTIRFRFLDTPLSVYNGDSKLFKGLGHIGYQLWKQVILPVKASFNSCDIVFCVDDCVPCMHLGYKTVQVIHDAFCFEMPENYGKLWLKLYKATAVPGARRAAAVIAPTAYSKTQVARYFGLELSKIQVIGEAPKRTDISGSNASNVLRDLELQTDKFLLHVGSMFKRKNLPLLVQAFARLDKTRHPDLKLVIAGSVSTNTHDNDHQAILELIEEHNLKSQVIITGYLTDAQISQLYDGALLYIFPSVNEGFGLPVLESFAHHTPVIVANNTCLPEVGSNAILSFDPFNVNDITEKIEAVISNENLRKNLIAKGDERLKEFSWTKAAKEIIDVFKNIV